ncbi:hypothetical protein KIN34_09890 [Cellulomonas sp. DKR-3]|uniref:Sulfotransferase family protein n=1 Tax=Cellulomonas fulva TaxID=2835530 RepID=A0ABS5TZL6_9CELL|nr:hypothetical protein [Cellulomonas fulva]MBT0994597.1 hypothetical protein [Cellulomonas fulva]
MSQVDDPQDLLLPEHARLLHIGSPKTGTTALQNAMSRLRDPLLEHGVRYPGTTLHHQYGASVLLQRRSPAWGGALPPHEWWDELQAEIDAETERRVLVSYEMICQGDLAATQRFADALGPQTHAVLVVRSFGTLLPSMWQQRVKMGLSQPLSGFLREALADLDAVRIRYSDAFHRSDGLHLVERWARVLGPENVTVVVLDPSRRSLLFDAFEGMLGLPSGLLDSAPSDGHAANRSMSLAEAELTRRLNQQVLGARGAPRPEHRRLVWQGAVDRMLKTHVPTREEGKVAIPQWALEPCQEAGLRMADEIRARGVRVHGDLDVLSAPVPTLAELPDDARDLFPTDAAAQALIGMFAGALDRPVTMKPVETKLDASHPLARVGHPGASPSPSPRPQPTPAGPSTGTTTGPAVVAVDEPARERASERSATLAAASTAELLRAAGARAARAPRRVARGVRRRLRRSP